MGKLSQGLLSNGKLSGISGGGYTTYVKKPSLMYIPSLSTKTQTIRTSVTGSGWIECIFDENASTISYFSLKVDGVYIVGTSSTGLRLDSPNTMCNNIRFENGFDFYNDIDDLGVVYKLGDDYETTTLNLYDPNAGSTDTTLRLNVSGSGLLKTITSRGPYGTVIKIDGVTIFDGIVGGTVILNVRYNTSLQMYDNTGFTSCEYIPD